MFLVLNDIFEQSADGKIADNVDSKARVIRSLIYNLISLHSSHVSLIESIFHPTKAVQCADQVTPEIKLQSAIAKK